MRKEADVNYRHATPTGSPWNERQNSRISHRRIRNRQPRNVRNLNLGFAMITLQIS